MNRINKPEIGMYVYKPYQSAVAGVIIALEDITGRLPRAFVVLWLNGEKTIEYSYSVCDFEALIEDHKKKLVTHTKTLDKLKGLIY